MNCEKKEVTTILKRFLFILFCGAMLVGCGNTVDSGLPPENNTITETDFDLNKYMNKTWIMDKENSGNSYSNYLSFVINKNENGMVEGKFSICEILENNSELYTDTNSVGTLTGSIQNGVFDCQLEWEEEGFSGNLQLKNRSDDKIEAVLNVDKKNGDDMPESGTYLFRPYKLKDSEEKRYSYEDTVDTIELDGWGAVKFISRVRSGGKHNILEIYLTSMENDILYNFTYLGNYPHNVCVKEYSFEDLDNDGLKDLILILTGNEEGEGESMARVYYQKNNGGFKNDKKLFVALNGGKHSYNQSVKSVVEYIRSK